ncbi:MAG: hypothetical protein M1823_002652 [Watsoniomyces obsoletus]|nr:MAG: hypothetical protein M1823_002652 [Watsoniomyces obsoletus]
MVEQETAAMGDRAAFFYGTLMAPPVLYRVCYGTITPELSKIQGLSVRPAMLHGYRRRRVKYCDYPAITEARNSSVRGSLVTGLTDDDIWNLDLFEGNQYKRVKVQVTPLRKKGDDHVDGNSEGHDVDAETYVWIDDDGDLEDKEWDFADFKKRKMARWVGTDDEYEEVDEAVRDEKHDPTGGRSFRGQSKRSRDEHPQEHMEVTNAATSFGNLSKLPIAIGPQCSTEGWRKRNVVTSFICDIPDWEPSVKVALFKRSDKVRTYQGKWAGCSGSIDTTDASPEAAARRELQEETGLTGEDLKLLRPGKPFRMLDESLQTEWSIYPFAFVLKSGAKSITIDWEHTEWRFVSATTLAEADTVPNLDISLNRTLVPPFVASVLRDLNTDQESGASVLATKAVEVPLKALDHLARGGQSPVEIWKNIRMYAWHLAKNGRPSMGAAITSALLVALAMLEAKLDRNDVAYFVEQGRRALQTAIRTRQRRMDLIVQHFLKTVLDRPRELCLLTISSSSTIKKCILGLLRSPLLQHLTLHVPECRPLCEGASFASSIVSKLKGDEGAKLHIVLATDASMALLAQRADYVLLGADRIACDGDVSNKTGSLPAVLAASNSPKDTKVLVISELDKVAGPGISHETLVENGNPDEVTKTWTLDENLRALLSSTQVEVKNVYFEWVPAEYVDAYITDGGAISRDEIERRSEYIQKLELKYFGDL